MKIVVDKDACVGHGRCHAVAPAVYPLDDLGYCDVDELEVPAGLEEAARLGVDNCPERAIDVADGG